MYPTQIDRLKDVDPILADLIGRVGACDFEARTEGSHFEALLRAIISQQLSTKAARTIRERVYALFAEGVPSPEGLLALSDEALRGAGLSRQKLNYMRDLAGRVLAGDLPLVTIEQLSDEEVIRALTQVKGIGRWSGQMFLMFRLGRLDVLPEADLGIQNAIWKAYGLSERPTPKRVLEIGAAWAPHRSIASWYLWRSLDTAAPLPGS